MMYDILKQHPDTKRREEVFARRLTGLDIFWSDLHLEIDFN